MGLVFLVDVRNIEPQERSFARKSMNRSILILQDLGRQTGYDGPMICHFAKNYVNAISGYQQESWP
jgi:hypothetical protein